MGEIIASVQEAARITTVFSITSVVLALGMYVAAGVAYYKWKGRKDG